MGPWIRGGALLLGLGAAHAVAAVPPIQELSFEELASITITTAAKHEERLFATPAAVAVLTNEEIARSGATSVPEALRWVPGLDVAQINAAEWAVSARGFNGRVANKLLVMLDGRSVYTPQFAGVYWDAVNPMLEDLDRIEIVRGPGGSLWGANAVNGVINILSKSARDTQGTLVYGGGGNEKRVLAGVRHGWALNDHAWVRAYASYQSTDASVLPDGSVREDGFENLQGGFRLDAEQNGGDHLTLQGDAFHGQRQQFTTLVTSAGLISSPQPTEIDGVNLLGRWTRKFPAGSTFSVQGYWDYAGRDTFTLAEVRNTFDLEVQQRTQIGEQHNLTCGAGYRFSGDRTTAGLSGGFVPARYDFQLSNIFIQDEITLRPHRLQLTLGTKLEHNSYTGFEMQPSARLLWTPNDQQTVWTSVSRAVRNPNRADRAIRFDAQYVAPGPGVPLPVLIRALGNPAVDSEALIAWEAGWRIQPNPGISADLSVFYNRYDSLILGIPDAAGTFVEATPAPLHLVSPLRLLNNVRAHSHGGELSVTWQPTPEIRCAPFYSYLLVEGELVQPGDRSLATITESAPEHQAGLRTSFDLPLRLKLDCNLRWVGAVPAYAVKSYFEADVRFAWEIRPGLELVLTGQNLLHSRHDEFGPQTIEPRYLLQRGVYAKLAWKF